MQPNEVIEGNRAIAAFMGVELVESPWPHKPAEEQGQWIWEDKSKVFKISVKYHSSWNWLMPVVEKISRIEVERRFDEDQDRWIIWTHHPVTFGMLDEQGRPMVRFCYGSLHCGNTLIEATWLAVVDFIKTNSQPLNNKG